MHANLVYMFVWEVHLTEVAMDGKAGTGVCICVVRSPWRGSVMDAKFGKACVCAVSSLWLGVVDANVGRACVFVL